MLKRFLAVPLALAASIPAAAQTGPSEAEIRAHVEILASDRFQGRLPGTIGEAVAGHYIAAQFAQAGLEPAMDGSFYQPVPLIDRRTMSVNFERTERRADGTLRRRAIRDRNIVAFGHSELERLRGDVLFAGFGDPEALDPELVRARIVLVLRGRPSNAEDFPGYRQRIQAIADMGAAAVLAVTERGQGWDAVRAQYLGGRSRLASADMPPVEGAIVESAVLDWFEDDGIDVDDIFLFGERPNFEPFLLGQAVEAEVATEIRRYNGYNIGGRIAGSGDAGESVVFLAHYDHFGVCAPERAPDRICNGAVDNASGTAALIAVAQALGDSETPVRDIVFLATTAEEMGLLGARYFVDNPSISLYGIVAALNLDTVAISPAGAPVGIVGRGETNLDATVDNVAAELGRDSFSDDALAAFVQRQDGWAFLQRGVPAIMAGGSFTDLDALADFFEGPYHRADDDLANGIELGGVVEDAALHVALGRAFADPSRYVPPER